MRGGGEGRRGGDVLPAHAGGEDAKGFPADFVFLVQHEEVCGSAFWSKGCLAVFDGPLQFLGRDEDFAETGVDFGFAGIETGDCGYEVLVFEDVSVWDCGSVCTRAPVCCSILLTVSPTYLNIVFSTFLRCAKVVFAHSTCASFALAIARSIPSVVEGLTWPSIRPVAGQ